MKAWQWRAVCKLVLSSARIGYVVEYIEVLANTGKYPKWGIALTTFGMGVKKGREMRALRACPASQCATIEIA
ncbi:MAG: hypothetical protein JF585_03580 [Burkholderiales bacterium]|nr:hypothetical protein [Burkholderiales bacterium]